MLGLGHSIPKLFQRPKIEPSFFDEFGTPAAAYSLRDLSGNNPNVIRVRRASDNAERDFKPSEISDGTLLAWVNGADNEVMDNPDITSASGWTIGGNTTYNSGTEAFDLAAESGLTVRQDQSEEGITYEVTLTISSYTSGGIRIYAGGTQSVILNSVGTHTVTIAGGSANAILGINPSSASTLSISAFSAIQKTSDGNITTWYDQSGNGNHATQATASAQPLIVDAGSLILENGLPAVKGDGVDDDLVIPVLYTEDHSVFTVVNNRGLFGSLLGTTSGGNYIRFLSANSVTWYVPDTTNNAISASGFNNVQSLLIAIKEDGTKYLQRNNTTESSDASVGVLTSSAVRIFSYAGGTRYAGVMQEMIVYQSGKRAQKEAIKSNINEYYNIY